MALSEIPSNPTRTTHRYLRRPSPVFFPDEALVPESGRHLRLRTGLFLVLEHGLRGRAFVGSDQFLYWDPTDAGACLAPDLLVRMGGPLAILSSFKTWEHGAPHVAVEIASVSNRSPRELAESLEKYRRSGVAEVVWFDPEDESRPLRLWDNVNGDLVERDLSDREALRCDALGGYWTLVAHPELGRTLRLSHESDGTMLWPTAEEAERAEKEAERAEKEAERAEKEAALARVAELERELEVARRS